MGKGEKGNKNLRGLVRIRRKPDTYSFEGSPDVVSCPASSNSISPPRSPPSLWHELTVQLQEFVRRPQVQRDDTLFQLFARGVASNATPVELTDCLFSAFGFTINLSKSSRFEHLGKVDWFQKNEHFSAPTAPHMFSESMLSPLLEVWQV